jgi:hypothetical protein
MQNWSSDSSCVVKIEAVRYHIHQLVEFWMLLAYVIQQENQLLTSITGFHKKEE